MRYIFFTLTFFMLLTSAMAGQQEIHAVWDHSGSGLYPGDWPRTIRLLAKSHVTDLFVNVAGMDFAHYNSSILPRSQTFARNGDQLTACILAAKGTGVRVHAWLICFAETHGKMKYLSPAKRSVQSKVLSVVDELQSRYEIQGVHLDFVRWGVNEVKPKNAAAAVTQFVTEARRRVKRPKWLTAAVYGRYPSCITSVGQDWVQWLNLGIVDYVVPMDYTESKGKFEEFMRLQSVPTANARRTIAGIGVTASESKLNAVQVAEQIKLARKYGLAGTSLFDLDATLENKILPYVRQNAW